MKIAQKKSLTKRTFIISAVVILLLGGGAFALWRPTSELNNEKLTESADNTSTVEPEQAEGQESAESKDGDLPQKPPYQENRQNEVTTQGTDNGAPPEKPRVTRAEQSGDTIKVTAIFNAQSSGSCELRLSKTGEPSLVRTTGIVTGPSYYVCGFNVPRSELSSGGRWQAVVVHKIGSSSASSDPKIVEVN